MNRGNGSPVRTGENKMGVKDDFDSVIVPFLDEQFPDERRYGDPFFEGKVVNVEYVDKFVVVFPSGMLTSGHMEDAAQLLSYVDTDDLIAFSDAIPTEASEYLYEILPMQELANFWQRALGHTLFWNTVISFLEGKVKKIEGTCYSWMTVPGE